MLPISVSGEQYADINTRDGQGRQPIHVACGNNLVDLAKWLHDEAREGPDQRRASLTAVVIGQNIRRGWQPIHFCAAGGGVEVMEWLLDSGINPHTPTEDDSMATPLVLAVKYGQLPIAQLYFRRFNSQHPSLLSQTDVGDMSLLHIVSDLRVAKFLYFKGASLYWRSRCGELPIHQYAKSNDRLEVLQWAIDDRMFPIYPTDSLNWMAVHHSASRDSHMCFMFLVRRMKREGVDFMQKVSNGRTTRELAEDYESVKVLALIAEGVF